MRRIVFLLLAGLCIAAPAFAQQGAPAAQDTRALVTYTVAGRLAAASEPGAVPIDLLELLAREPRLARLRVGEGAPADFVEAVFVFPTADAFRAWYESEEGRAVIRALTARLRDPASRLTFLRPSLQLQIPG